MKSEQADLVAHILDTGVALDDDFHSVLDIVAINPNADMLRTIFTTKYELTCSGFRLEKCLTHDIKNDRTETALYLLRKGDQEHMQSYGCAAFQDACKRGNPADVRVMVDGLEIVDLEARANNSEFHSVQYTAFYGHKHILQYFF